MVDDTLLETLTDRRPGQVALAPDGNDLRYKVGDVIGRGGMGEVRAAHDTRIEREVAVKLMRSELTDAVAVARFFREAKVQGGLEHPAVPPVYDLGVDREGNPYFVMKRLAGTTLQDVIVAKSSTRQQLLARFVDVCFAVGFAHSRGVIHRDLKPSNIMLGEFNEIYVLDWGLARIGPADDESVRQLRRARSESGTEAGDLLGTPGYMAPEQARGHGVTERADVFSLGCVLYEILVGAPALPRSIAALAETLETQGLHPRQRDPDVPPELDKLCALATGQDPATRPSARKLAEELQAYLDGDRDFARRKQLATEHAEHARDALAAGDDDESRARAMREVGRALVFDPANRAAQELLAKLLIAPDRIPAQALAAADAERAAARTKVIRDSAMTYGAYAVLGCLLFAFPIHAAWPVILAIVLSAITAVIFGVMSRRDLPLRTPWELVVVTANGLLLSVSALLLGPLFLTPIFTVGALTLYLSQPAGYSRWWIVASHAIGFGVPLVLELVGVLPSTFATVDGHLVLAPWTFDLTPLTTGLLTAMAMITQGAIGWRLLTTTLNVQLAAQNRVYSQQWHLEQLLPKV